MTASPGDTPSWYLVDGSLMVAAPDMLLVKGQEFIVLPLDGWGTPATAVRLGGRLTCDADDCYPRPGQPPLSLPVDYAGGLIAVFGVGAYQAMLSGRGGAHHCLAPEPRRVIIESDSHALVARESGPQPLAEIVRRLGYSESITPAARRGTRPRSATPTLTVGAAQAAISRTR